MVSTGGADGLVVLVDIRDLHWRVLSSVAAGVYVGIELIYPYLRMGKKILTIADVISILRAASGFFYSALIRECFV